MSPTCLLLIITFSSSSSVRRDIIPRLGGLTHFEAMSLSSDCALLVQSGIQTIWCRAPEIDIRAYNNSFYSHNTYEIVELGLGIESDYIIHRQLEILPHLQENYSYWKLEMIKLKRSSFRAISSRRYGCGWVHSEIIMVFGWF